MTKAAELRDMSDEQLALTLKDACEQLFRRRLKAQMENQGTAGELTRTRRLIARVKTIQNERARAASAN
ncbi:MAG: 50S ribosomal protein L29 [Planctomycetia bacterium]|jgi:large subunit ribosomal protein L29